MKAREKYSESAIAAELASLPEMGGTPREVSPELRARITKNLKAALKPVRPLASMPLLALQFAGVFALLAFAMVALMGTAGMASLGMWQRAAIVIVLAAGVALFSISLAWQIVPGSLPRMRAGLVLDAFACGFLASAALLFPWRASNAFLAEGWPCLIGGVATAVPGAILFTLLIRRGAPRISGVLGGTLGAIAGLLGLTVLEFQCIHQSAPHLLVWHFAPLAIWIAVGVAIARVAERFSSGGITSLG